MYDLSEKMGVWSKLGSGFLLKKTYINLKNHSFFADKNYMAW